VKEDDSKTRPVTSSGLAFFSGERVNSITEKTGSTRLQELIEKLEDIILTRLCMKGDSPWHRIHFKKPEKKVEVHAEVARSYIEGHSFHPYLLSPAAVNL
jgi:hypothetical protein